MCCKAFRVADPSWRPRWLAGASSAALAWFASPSVQDDASGHFTTRRLQFAVSEHVGVFLVRKLRCRIRPSGRGLHASKLTGCGVLQSLHARVRTRGPACLRVGYENFSIAEILAALTTLGVTSISQDMSKSELVEVMRSIGITARDLLAISRDRRKGHAQGKGVQSHDVRRRTDFWHFRAMELRIVLNEAGFLERTDGWGKQQLITALRHLRVKPQDASNLLGSQRGQGTQESHGEAQQRNRDLGARHTGARHTVRSWQKGRHEAEWEWLKEDFLDKQTYEDEYLEERKQRYDYVGDDEYGFSGTASKARYQEYFGSRRGRRVGRGETRFSAPQTRKARMTHPGKLLEEPEMVMARAIREGWVAEDLSRSQAVGLLGTPQTPTSQEVRDARKRLVLRWHPDKNPADPVVAAKALQLALAACALFE